MTDLGSSRGPLVISFTLSLLLGSGDQRPALAERTFEPDGRLMAVADSTDDGPHVYWVSDSAAIVFYLCDGEVEARTFESVDTLRFRGFCGDSEILYSIPAQAPTTEPYIFEGASKIFAVSDVHGEYEAFASLLRNAGVIDADLHWDWGDGHLVINGDTFDRGDRVSECLWLIYRLEQEAEAEGGEVHMVLGNHELMPMRGDLRYVNKKYLDGIVRRAKVTYQDLYGPRMELGRWLRTKNAIIKVNGILFVHGGIPPEAVERGLGLEEMNEAIRATADMRSYEVAFSELETYLVGGQGPLWYRGYHRASEDYARATDDQIATILSAYDAKAIVVGHSEYTRVESLYGGAVFRLDVPLKDLGSLQGLLWREDRFYRVTGTGDLEPLD